MEACLSEFSFKGRSAESVNPVQSGKIRDTDSNFQLE